MERPPCPKCKSNSVFLQKNTLLREEPIISCYTCGWRLHGAEQINLLIVGYNNDIAEKARLEAEIERKKIEEEHAKLLPPPEEPLPEEAPFIDGLEWRLGEIDPELGLAWAGPTEPGPTPVCSWPPCGSRSTKRSKYCCRECKNRVARLRYKLRREQEAA